MVLWEMVNPGAKLYGELASEFECGLKIIGGLKLDIPKLVIAQLPNNNICTCAYILYQEVMYKGEKRKRRGRGRRKNS